MTCHCYSTSGREHDRLPIQALNNSPDVARLGGTTPLEVSSPHLTYRNGSLHSLTLARLTLWDGVFSSEHLLSSINGLALEEEEGCECKAGGGGEAGSMW